MSACLEEIHDNPTIFGDFTPKNEENSQRIVEFSPDVVVAEAVMKRRVERGWENGKVGGRDK